MGIELGELTNAERELGRLLLIAEARIKELEKALREAKRVRDEWCAEYVRLRDCRKAT
jgi:hypothetical protein